MGQILDSIHAPQDLKKLSGAELETLCEEIRQRIIHIVGQNGGHLASNLGAVELTVALHRVLDLPKDKLVWDVGHQAYTHKLLTGRNAKMDTIRQENGISGFPKREESAYDAFNVGHASTAISAAVGMAAAMQITGQKERVVAVVGDGALTGGLALEGLNNAFYLHRNLVVVLNDNKMSISRSVGSLARYLSVLRTKPHYRRAKGRLVRFLDSMPVVGGSVHRLLTRGKNTIKRFVYRRNIFEDMGFVYYGPFDGHDLESLIQAFQVACSLERPVLVHVCTEKGKGYAYAEEDPGSFHGVPAFDIESGLPDHSGQNFSKVFGHTMCQLAGEDRRICAITAAMQTGTGLTDFRRTFAPRFFDVGIAEEHAVTFAAGLATQGMLPVFAVYSTFLQRSYDELLHDVGLQNLHVVLAVDRAGFVGDDGGNPPRCLRYGLPQYGTPLHYFSAVVVCGTARHAHRSLVPADRVSGGALSQRGRRNKCRPVSLHGPDFYPFGEKKRYFIAGFVWQRVRLCTAGLCCVAKGRACGFAAKTQLYSSAAG